MKFEIEVDDLVIIDTIERADTSHWCSSWDQKLTDGSFWFIREDDDSETRIVVGPSELARGLSIMAVKHSLHFSNMIRGAGGGWMGDILVQLCCFGEIRYE